VIRKSQPVRQIANAETDFASLVTGFLSGYSPEQKPFVVRVCKAWAGAWVRQAPGLTPQPGSGVEALEHEIFRDYYRGYYQRNREHILQRQRLNYQRRRGGGYHE
jgi:hypothetical protein